ncbi:hypothetical protein T07_513 [Trichinella nelsoni]|uniref:Uncharacterized protein n=1 Tax=Trichinella nelsoni TaxID=6336 RepID=A0A0V0RP43_9BILA|nr:hypothetical protein T07_513 [Trichinella nelsoni]
MPLLATTVDQSANKLRQDASVRDSFSVCLSGIWLFHFLKKRHLQIAHQQNCPNRIHQCRQIDLINFPTFSPTPAWLINLSSLESRSITLEISNKF